MKYTYTHQGLNNMLRSLSGLAAGQKVVGVVGVLPVRLQQ